MTRTRVRGTLTAAMFFTALSVLTLPARNGAFEFCTTRAYGCPLPWWVEWCKCEKGSNWPDQIRYWSGNILAGFIVAFVARRSGPRSARAGGPPR
jgi:hypothetical protein